MKDDPREIDWPERHIKALEMKVAKLEAIIGPEDKEDDLEDTLIDWLSQLDNKVRKLTPRPSGAAGATPSRRVDSLERRFSEMAAEQSTTIRRVARLEKELAGTDRAVAQLNDRVSAVENRINRFSSTFDEVIGQLREKISWVQDTGGEFQQSVDRFREVVEHRLLALEGYPRRTAPGLARISEPGDGPVASARVPIVDAEGGYQMPWENGLPETGPLEPKDPKKAAAWGLVDLATQLRKLALDLEAQL